MQKLLETALDYEANGWKLVPLHGKEPLVRWSGLREKTATEQVIKGWFDTFGDKLTGLGLVTGLDEDVCVLDLEKGEDPERFDLPETVRAKSGGGGWHYYFRVPDDYDEDTLPTTDLRKHGIEGELRADKTYTTLPPSIHPSGNKYEWVVPLDQSKLAPLPNRFVKYAESKEYEPTDWQETMRGATEGERHTKTVSVAGKLLHHFPKKNWKEVVHPLLHAWNKTHNAPPLPQSEINSIYSSLAKKKHPEKTASKKKRELLTVSAVMDMPESEKPQFLVSGLVPEKGITALSGHPGCGKSWFMLSMANSIATGEAFLDLFKTKQANVLVIDEESGIWEMRRRMKLLSYPKEAPIFFYSQSGFKVDDEDDIELIKKTIRDESIGLVVIDPFVAVHSGVENSAEEAQAVMEQLQLLNEAGAAVLFIHHHRKGANGSSGHSLRGSSAYSGRLDSHITIDHTDDTGTTKSLNVEHVKSRRGKNVDSFQVTIRQDKLDDPILLESSGMGSGRLTKKGLARKAILELLKQGTLTRKKIIHEVQTEEDVGGRNITDALDDLATDKLITRGKKGREHTYTLANDKTNDS
jgi:KaiC/GvpD/RAD55 family RecA-like ATPase